MTRRRDLIRSWLYVPGNNERFIEQASGTDADAVIFDLEDSVPAGEKSRARDLVRDAIAGFPADGRPSVWVRVNPFGTDRFVGDLDAVVQPGLDGVRLPKVDDPGTVAAVADRLAAVERRAGLVAGSIPLVCGIESAAGVATAFEIAAASDRVRALAFGAADYCADIGVEISWEATAVPRSLLVIASRRAGIEPPVDAAYLDVDDEDGLREASVAARRLGFFGRSAIHPRQVAVINAVYTPTAAEVERARSVIEAAQVASTDGQGAFRMPSGEFVDAAIVRRARSVLDLTEGRDVR